MTHRIDQGRCAPHQGSGVPIRAATAADAEAVAQVHHDGWTQSYRGLLPHVYLDGLSYEACRSRWQGGIGGATRVFVAEQHGDVIGFVSVGPCADPDATQAGEVWDLWVAEKARGAGVGRDLLGYGLRTLARSHRAAVVWVLRDNLRGRSFYEREGGVRDGLTRTTAIPGGSMTDVRYLFDLRGIGA